MWRFFWQFLHLLQDLQSEVRHFPKQLKHNFFCVKISNLLLTSETFLQSRGKWFSVQQKMHTSSSPLLLQHGELNSCFLINMQITNVNLFLAVAGKTCCCCVRFIILFNLACFEDFDFFADGCTEMSLLYPLAIFFLISTGSLLI